jgi:type I restriction-modification system DNA methylase subunit
MEIFYNYLKDIFEITSRGGFTENSFYGSLKTLIEDYSTSINKKIEVTTIPERTEAGNPDFRIWDGKSKIIGYIEAKDPQKVRNLDNIEDSEQIKRYLEAFPNFILTNFIEFRLYRNGLLVNKPIIISDYYSSYKQAKKPNLYNIEEFIELLNLFFNFIIPLITTSKTLAEILAKKAAVMRDYVIKPELLKDRDNYFNLLFGSFKRHLIEDLKEEDFADLFSQTFSYGLFIAKYQFETQQTLFGEQISDLPFTTKTSYDYIQKNFGLLREIFKVISTHDMPRELEIIVDDIVDILNHTNIYKLLSETKRAGKRDPIFHLYETFLLSYDKEKKRKLGIFYTPLEVVSFIVNSVNEILKDKELFNANNGLATYESKGSKNQITLLDPAVGTGTFLIYAIQKAIEEAEKTSKTSYYLNEFIKKHILKNFYAFEIMIAPYVVSHLKTIFTLTENNYRFTSDDKVNIYLTNTLEFSERALKGSFPGIFEQTLVTEQKNAYEVKNKIPILIVIGNPPYSVSSQNKIDLNTEFGKFYESYKENVRKEEKNIQPLSDDYIKFLAFAHFKINQTGSGIVAMITNNSFLDGIIHRDMRKKLLDDFDNIYILNLHGDIKRSESTKELKDENVFDITQGVSINIFVKTNKKQIDKRIFYKELIGLREDKYSFLDNHNVKNTDWVILKPENPYYFFTNKEFINSEKYNNFVSIDNIFIKNSIGIVTSRDNFAITTTNKEMLDNLTLYSNESFSDFEISEKFDLKDIGDWNIKDSRKSIIKEGIQQELVKKYNYRIFNEKYIYYDKSLVTRPRPELMQNLFYENLSIVALRNNSKSNCGLAFITNKIGDKHFISETDYYFPLWLYKKDNNPETLESLLNEDIGKTSNINEEIKYKLENQYKKQISYEDVFYYIYSILYSNVYKEKYMEFLKIDFPKIPFTNNYELFIKLSLTGKNLIDLHIMNSDKLVNPKSKFEGETGNGIIKNITYNLENKNLFLNDTQYFTNIEPEIYNYFIGSYQVLNKWLKDKKGQKLSIEDINYFVKIIKVLEETIVIQKEIDKIYPEIEKNLVIFNE